MISPNSCATTWFDRVKKYVFGRFEKLMDYHSRHLFAIQHFRSCSKNHIKSIFVKLLLFAFITTDQSLIAQDKETSKCAFRFYHILLERY